MKTMLRVLSQTEAVSVQSRDGSMLQKCSVVVQEVGGRYEDSYVVTLLGALASEKYTPGELVWGALRFQAKEYHPRVNGVPDQSRTEYLMDVTAYDLVKMNPEVKPF